MKLAKIMNPTLEWSLGFDCALYKKWEFNYTPDGFKFRKGIIEMDILSQYQLFDYMNSLFIDYRGLIDANLAISVHDLPENPYK